MGTMEDIAMALMRIAAAMEFSAAAGTTASRANGALQPQYQPGPGASIPTPGMGLAPMQPQYQPQAPQGITAEAITALIQPHVGNVQIKEALGATMREMGINALPDTQAHQFGELYQRFQGVIARFTQNPQPGPTPGASII
jgi:hypothetical protein